MSWKRYIIQSNGATTFHSNKDVNRARKLNIDLIRPTDKKLLDTYFALSLKKPSQIKPGTREVYVELR